MGPCWQLWAGTAMYAVPVFLRMRADDLPNSPVTYRIVPTKVVAIVGLLGFGALWAAIAVDAAGGSAGQVRNSFVLLSIPGFVIGCMEEFGREGRPWVRTWPVGVGGAALVVVGVFLARTF